MRGAGLSPSENSSKERRDLPRVTVAAMFLMTFPVGCDNDQASAVHTSDVIDIVGELVPLRTPTDEDFLLYQLLELGELQDVTDAEVVDARLRTEDTDEESFLIVAERDDGFDQSAMEVFIELGEDFSASPRFTPVEGEDRTFASECCVARFIDDVAIVAGDSDGQLKSAVLALE